MSSGSSLRMLAYAEPAPNATTATAAGADEMSARRDKVVALEETIAVLLENTIDGFQVTNFAGFERSAGRAVFPHLSGP
jgi:hypothetical protein